MSLKHVHDKLDEIPETFRPLYTEKGGKFEFTGVSGIRTQADVDRVNASLEKERGDHKTLKDRFGVLGDRKLEDVVALADRVPELETLAKGKVDEAKLDEMATQRGERLAKTRLAPVETELRKIKAERETEQKELVALRAKDRTRTISDAFDEPMRAEKIIADAIPDVRLYGEQFFEIVDGKVVTKEGGPFPAGLTPKEWFVEMRTKRPHWWPGSKGTDSRSDGRNGALPGGGENPFSHDGWNLTAQGAFVTAHGMEKASEAAKRAGTTVGGPRPPKPVKTAVA